MMKCYKPLNGYIRCSIFTPCACNNDDVDYVLLVTNKEGYGHIIFSEVL